MDQTQVQNNIDMIVKCIKYAAPVMADELIETLSQLINTINILRNAQEQTVSSEVAENDTAPVSGDVDL